MTTDWSKTWAGTNGWYDGYDSKNTGSFVDLSKLTGTAKTKALDAVRENIIGLLEQKGVNRTQILDETTDVGKFYKTQLANATKGGTTATKTAFQTASQHTTTASDRGNTWGSDNDDSMGRTYLDKIIKGGTATVDDLYDKGFGRAADKEGKDYWEKQIALNKANPSKGMSLVDVAKFFRNSEEAKIKSTYADQYGRDIDQGGLDYWMQHTGSPDYKGPSKGGTHNTFDASKLVSDTITATGKHAQAETIIRKSGWENLGQASSKDQRDKLPTLGTGKLFTDMDSKEVAVWTKAIQDGKLSLEDVTDIIEDRADRMNAFNKYDSDDWDEANYPGGPKAQPTGMGRFASIKDIQATIDNNQTPDQIRAALAKTTWAALGKEKDKEIDDSSEDFKKHKDKWFGTIPGKEKTYKKQPDFTPKVPVKPGVPGKLPVDRTNIEYMPDLKADTFSSTPYKEAKAEFDIEQGKKQTPTTLTAPTVMKRFTDTSAKGVRVKRSKASASNRSRGTGQLKIKREQTQSLNI